jgi:hypothetical protein
MGTLWTLLVERAGLADNASLAEVVETVHSMPYGRPTQRNAHGALAEWRGTCSSKHALLAAVLAERWPGTEPRLVHRVYRCTPEGAARRFGPTAAATVPEEGLWDVHRYLTIQLHGNRVAIDVTFPSGPAWDGASSMPVACGQGTDHAAGSDPDADKRALEEAYCDPGVREPFIAALSLPATTPRDSTGDGDRSASGRLHSMDSAGSK